MKTTKTLKTIEVFKDNEGHYLFNGDDYVPVSETLAQALINEGATLVEADDDYYNKLKEGL